MNSFSDFNIKPKRGRFVEDKIKMMKVLNQGIIVHNFKIDESKFRNSNSRRCLSLQIEFNNQMHVLFTGSKVLTEMIEQVSEDDLPFKTVITKEGETFQFN